MDGSRSYRFWFTMGSTYSYLSVMRLVQLERLATLSDERPCMTYRYPFLYPAQQSIMANLVASVGMRQGWGVAFVRAAYRRWLQLGQETGSEPNLSQSLRDVGVEPERALAYLYQLIASSRRSSPKKVHDLRRTSAKRRRQDPITSKLAPRRSRSIRGRRAVRNRDLVHIRSSHTGNNAAAMQLRSRRQHRQ